MGYWLFNDKEFLMHWQWRQQLTVLAERLLFQFPLLVRQFRVEVKGKINALLW